MISGRTKSGKGAVITAAIALVFLAPTIGCEDLKPIERDVCGNGVIEALEDCETSEQLAGTCGAPDSYAPCEFICDETECPAGWSCGADSICYQGAGTFTYVTDVPANGERTEIADFNADGYGDLAWSSVDITRFRFGPFIDTEVSHPVAATRGLGVADVNGDGSSDGFVAGPNNWSILLGTPDLEIKSSFHPSGSIGVGRHLTGAAPVLQRDLESLVAPIGISEGDVCQGGEAACVVLYASNAVADVGFAFDDGAGAVSAAVIGNLNDDERDVRIAVAQRAASDVTLYPMECGSSCDLRSLVIGSPVAASLVDGRRAPGAATTFLEPQVAPGGALFGDLEGDGDSDLLVWSVDKDGQPALGVLFNHPESGDPFAQRLVGSCTSSTCNSAGADPCSDDLMVRSFATNFVGVGGGSPGDLLAVGQLDDTGYIDLVTSTGIFVATGGGPACGFDADFSYVSFGWVPGSAPWSQAVVGDLNGDGIDDVAAISPGVPQVEIYRGNATGALTRLVVDTDQPPAAIAVGDLDADGADDLLVALTIDDETSDIRIRWGNKSGGDSLTLALGQTFRVSAGGLAMGPSITDSQVFDADAEIFITGTSNSGTAGPNQSTISIVRGSANRAISSPVISAVKVLETAYALDPGLPTPGELPEGSFAGRTWCVGSVAPGRFFDASGSLDIATMGDLVAVPDRSSGGPTNRQLCDEGTGVRFPILEGRGGAGNGNLDAAPAWCEALEASGLSLCARSALLSAIDVDDDGLDELAIVAPVADYDSGLSCALSESRADNALFLADPSPTDPDPNSCVGTFQPRLVDRISGDLIRIERADFDDEPGEDLVVVTSTQVILYTGAGGELSDAKPIAGLPLAGCEIASATALPSGCDGQRRLAVLQNCGGFADFSVWGVNWSASALEASAPVVLAEGTTWPIAPGAALEAIHGDIDGNGLSDLFIRIGKRGSVFLADEAPTVGSEDVCLRRELSIEN